MENAVKRVYLIDATDYEKNPCFETRLAKVSLRLQKILRYPRLTWLYLGLVLFFLLCQWVFELQPSMVFQPIISLITSAIICFVGLLITSYLNEDAVYGRKWSLIFQKYYEINFFPPGRRKELHFCNMWIDAITLGVWADEALNPSLYEHLVVALDKCGPESDRYKVKFFTNTLTKLDAISVLSLYADAVQAAEEPAPSFIVRPRNYRWK